MSPPPRADRWRAFALGAMALVVYCANLRPIDSADTLGNSLVPITVLTRGTLAANEFAQYAIDRHQVVAFAWTRFGWLSSYPPATGVLLTPFYAIPVRLFARGAPSVAEWILFARQAGKIAAAIVTAASVALFYVVARRLRAPPGAAILTSLAYALGSQAWSTSSQALWQHGPGVAVTLLAVLCGLARLERPTVRAALAFGALCGLAVAIRVTNVCVVLPMVVWQLWARRPGRLALLIAGGAVGAALLTFNLVAFGDPRGGYATVAMPFGSPLRGLAGVLFSPARGLLVYFPLALLALWALARRRSVADVDGSTLALAAGCLLQLALIASWGNWWGGVSWGPRLLTEIQPLLLLLTLPLLAAGARVWTIVFVVFGAWSAALQGVGALLYTGSWNSWPAGIDESPRRLWDWRDNPVSRDLRWVNVQRLFARPKALDVWRAEVTAPRHLTLRAGESSTLPVRVRNTGTEIWRTYGEDNGCLAINLSWRLFDRAGTLLKFEGVRTPLGPSIGPQEEIEAALRIEAPPEPGSYRLNVTLVQECVDWFDARGVPSAPVELDVTR